MSFLDLLKIEFMKVKRSKIVPLIFIAPLLVVVSGVANLSNYFTPEYTNAWPAMFIQSALVYAYYLLPFSMIVVCVMIAGRETGNNGILKMLALPVSRCALAAPWDTPFILAAARRSFLPHRSISFSRHLRTPMCRKSALLICQTRLFSTVHTTCGMSISFSAGIPTAG